MGHKKSTYIRWNFPLENGAIDANHFSTLSKHCNLILLLYCFISQTCLLFFITFLFLFTSVFFSFHHSPFSSASHCCVLFSGSFPWNLSLLTSHIQFYQFFHCIFPYVHYFPFIPTAGIQTGPFQYYYHKLFHIFI